MKLLYDKMNHKLRYIYLAFLLLIGSAAVAQITVQSPYSKFGIGNIQGSLLPQLRSMGGISAGVFKTSYINNINMQNPASYAGINLTTLDIGMSGSFTQLKSGSLSENSFNSSLSHVAMAFPISLKSALSVGILPYSELGYNFKNTMSVGTTTDNTKTVDYIYAGEGGLSKAYLGYGIQFGDHFRVGANLEYLFGNLIQSRSTEYVNEVGAINSRNQVKNSVYGLNFSYGVQYDFRLDNKTALVIGYSGSSSSNLNSERSQYITQYLKNSVGEELTALDTLEFSEGAKTKLKLPLIHNFGFTVQRDNKWVVGADYRMGKWSGLSIAGVNQNLQDTYGFSVGGQFTPDITAINGYFKRVDYRLGFAYDKTYIQMNNQDVKQMAITFGLGLPLSSYARSSFYKMNVSAELGRRGKASNGLLQEQYLNLRLGFMLNDKWFQRFKFD
ncbi:outer membrane protein transport protein [Pedobacter sp. ASV28]|uniref:outer membrane protein transport protein n=1 Tax=Pedobacter sp. ASV28 TaxID=2795123 RepID=UPI001E3E5A9B|nr:outer membrane protein transport protein [Pedobacter sp. ASV28]